MSENGRVSCGCGPSGEKSYDRYIPVSRGFVATPAGNIPLVPSVLNWGDQLGGWRVRWSIGRSDYRVSPGLYAVGHPSPESPVFVSANYKLSFDRLRASLAGIDGWILVLDTKGINVWCAAGKGTFGTRELIERIEWTGLSKVVNHRRLILPQLGAPGVEAHTVKQFSGFQAFYGPVRAGDIPLYLRNGMKKTPEMRRVTFKLKERLALIPVEVVNSLWILAALMLSGALLSLWQHRVFSISMALDALPFVLAYIGGTALVPALLPWLPGRAFSVKGLWIGLALALLYTVFGTSVALQKISYWLTLPAITAFFAMNFTGSSTYTPQTGVMREVKTATPVIACAMLIGLILSFIGGWIGHAA